MQLAKTCKEEFVEVVEGEDGLLYEEEKKRFDLDMFKKQLRMSTIQTKTQTDIKESVVKKEMKNY